MTSYKVPGYYSKSEAETVKEKLEGKSYMRFKIEISNYIGNYTILVHTDCDVTEEELSGMFIFALIGVLHKLSY